jgi:carotenoid cleavage dioxygenase-like enzyme
VCIIFSSFIGFMSHPIKRISSVNTSIFYHDGRVLASCEIGPPMRVCLPSLKTVGWFTGWRAEGEAAPANPSIESDPESEPILGGKGIQGFYKEWTTAHVSY